MEGGPVVKADQPYVTLNDGHKMPLIGLGTYAATDTEALKNVVISAIMEHGYRHIDCAWIYGNEEKVGEALKHCMDNGVKREDLFITTKLFPTQYTKNEESLRESLTRLNLEYVDLYLIHALWPDMDYKTMEVRGPGMPTVWAEMERLKDVGLTRSIGVSNATVGTYVNLLPDCKKYRPAVNQLEVHTYCQHPNALPFFTKMGMHCTSFGPLGAPGHTERLPAYKDMNAFEIPLIKELAAKYEKTVAQVIMNHLNHIGVSVIPKTEKTTRLAENFDWYNFKMTDEEYTSMNALNANARFYDMLGMDHFGHFPIYY